MDKVSDSSVYLWYADKCIENGWSRDILVHQIEMKLYQRQAIGAKADNFERTLASSQSELARETLKNPYIDFQGSHLDDNPLPFCE